MLNNPAFQNLAQRFQGAAGGAGGAGGAGADMANTGTKQLLLQR